MPDVAELVTRDGVELVRTGTWALSTGAWTATREDLTAAIAALRCPAVQKPIVKIGHTDDRFTPGDGEPAVGWYDNLRLTDGGHTLIADQTVPRWLGDIQAAAWPNRSIEGTYNKRCGLNHVHPFVITAVALLGVTPPGVAVLRPLNSLDDVKALYGLAATVLPREGEVLISASIPSVAAAAEEQTGAMVALIPSEPDAARLAVDGGEPADQLHVTLAYLGDAVDLDAAARQDLIDAVSSAVNGAPVVQAEIFALSVFNPPSGTASADGRDRDACIVLGVGGDGLDSVHTLVGDALAWVGVPYPSQHAPWVPHVTVLFTEDLSRLADLVDRIGSVTFDRIRIALAGQTIDIPLIPNEPNGDTDADSGEVQAAVGDENQLKRYWLGEGLSKWATKRHPWTALYRHLRKHVGAERAKRIASQWFHDHFGYWPGDRRHRVKASQGDPMPNPQPVDADRVRDAWNRQAPTDQWVVEVHPDHAIVCSEADRSFARVPVTVDGDKVTFGAPEHVRPGYVPAEAVAASAVYASRDESRPGDPGPSPDPTPPPPSGEPALQPDQQPVSDDPPTLAEPEADPELPAEPEPETDPNEEDPVSDLSDIRSRLGLPEDADTTAIAAAVDALKAKADNPTPDPETVAASAAAEQKREELEKEVKVLASQVETMSTKLAAAEAEKATTVKAGVLDAAVKQGKIKPAERDQWSADYDEAPGAITRVLASIAPGTAVPVNPIGETTNPDAPGDIDAEWAAVASVYPPSHAGKDN